MSYVKRNLLEKETILFQTGKHWIIFFPVCIWFSLAYLTYCTYLENKLALIPLTLGVWFFLVAAIDFFFSEYAITNQRVFMKEGLIWRTSVETMLSSVAKSELQQSILGRILGYGQLIVFGFGGSNRFSNIRQPEVFQKQLNIQLEKH
ncbi:MAG: PH domain-containing protein [Pseudomonadota bacterium]